jgi:hypothetical protein
MRRWGVGLIASVGVLSYKYLSKGGLVTTSDLGDRRDTGYWKSVRNFSKYCRKNEMREDQAQYGAGLSLKISLTLLLIFEEKIRKIRL